MTAENAPESAPPITPPEPGPATLLPRVTAAAVDLLVAVPTGVLAGVGFAAVVARLSPSATLAVSAAGAALLWSAYRGITDRQGRGVGRWLAGIRLLGKDGRAPAFQAAVLRASLGPVAVVVPGLGGTRVERSEPLPLPERVGGAVGRNKTWLAASVASTAFLVFGSPMLASRLDQGANLSAWERFHEAHHDHGCCAARHELPTAWTECAGAIGGVLELKAKGLFESPAPAGAHDLFRGCTLVSAVEIAGASASESAVAPALAAALDGTPEARASALAFLGPDPGGVAVLLPGSDPLLRRLVRDADGAIVLSAVAALRPLSVDRVRPLVDGADASLARSIAAASPGFREGAAHVLGLSSGDDAAARAALEPLARGSDFAEAITSVEALLRRAPDDATASAALATWLTDVDGEERRRTAAVGLLRRLSRTPAPLAASLEASLKAPPVVRLGAAEALLARDPDHAGASEAILRLLLDGGIEPVHRSAASATLSRLGATPKPLADALTAAAKEPDPETKERAQAALSLRGLPSR